MIYLKMTSTKLMKITFIAFLALCLFSTKSFAQKQERQVLIYNVALGGITSGIGAAINKKKENKLLPTFFRGFKYGCVGGLFLYGGKKISYQINRQNNLALGWPSKIIHSYGSTIIENASKNEKDIFSKLSFPIGFVRFNFSIQKRLKCNVQLQPTSLASFFVNTAYWEFKPKESLLIGTPVFMSNSNYVVNNRGGGYALTNTFTYSDQYTSQSYEIFAHEHIHILQGREYLVMNTWFKNPTNDVLNKMNNNTKKILKHLYLDVPYNYLFYSMLYKNPPCYFKNYFEFEAKRFATNDFAKRCD
jgi:hypothetical protein